jgi:hypothetical protein
MADFEAAYNTCPQDFRVLFGKIAECTTGSVVLFLLL